MRLLSCILAILVLGTFEPEAFGQLYTFTNYNHRDGLHMASVSTCFQTEDGFLWIGTQGSELIRFDGKQFDEVRIQGKDNNHHITTIWPDGEDLLFASKYKGFYRYSRSNNKLNILNEQTVHYGEALGVCKLKSDYYFIGTRAIFSPKDDSYKILLNLKSSEPNINVKQIIKTSAAIFLLTENGGYRIADGEIKSLKKWLGYTVRNLNDFQFGYYDDGALHLLSTSGDRWLHLTLDGQGSFMTAKETKSPPIIPVDETIISYSYNPEVQQGGILTNKGKIYKQKGTQVQYIMHNYTEPLESPTSIFTDLYGDYWVCSDLRGLYKVSEEPFTKVNLTEQYNSGEISFVHRTLYGNVILSEFSGKTSVGDLYQSDGFTSYDFSTKGIAEIKGDYFLATNEGVRLFNPEKGTSFEQVYFENHSINSILADGNFLWVGVAGQGLYRIDTSNDSIIKINNTKNFNVPQYIYTGQPSVDGKYIYFGSNDGVFKLNKSSLKIERIKYDRNKMGAYSGVSIRDVYQTNWFTIEKGLIGIRKDGSVKIIEGDKYFVSTLFYTLNSDTYGNLIIGTNKGLTMLKMNAKGDVINVHNYNANSGFLGYETNIRAQYQSENQIFLGTVEGLFIVNTRFLEENERVLPPVITRQFVDNDEDLDEIYSFIFSFNVNHPRAGDIKYAYRLKDMGQEWQMLDIGVSDVRLHGLTNGDYFLEVKASYDGVHFSPISSYGFTVNLPIWKSNWFILVLMIGVILVNVILVNYYSSFEGNKLMSTKDIQVHLRLTPFILLFATITAPLSQILAPLVVPDLQYKLGQNLAVGFILLTLYLLSLNAKSTNKQYLFDYYLKAAFLLLFGVFMWEIYSSRLHPFNIIGVVLISTMTPYIFSKIKRTIILSVIVMSLSVVYISILDETVYPKFYFLIAMFVMVSLMVLASYMRYDSLEKLIFVSTVINKGNIPAIAFNKEGKVTYASENISNFANITHEKLLGDSISVLNNFVPFGEKFTSVDVTKAFVDGGKYMVPMQNMAGEVHWVEWSYKEFSKNIKVLLGQDVSEKLELENTYELLVQNAEDFIYRCDIDGNFIFLNDVCYTKLGYGKDELIGKFSLDIVAESHREEAKQYYSHHFSDNLKSSYREFPICKKNGDIIWVGQYVTTLYATGTDNYVQGFIALARDITEERNQQELIQDQQDAITSSINYARRIQYNLLPQQHEFEEAFDEYFIISRPKDIVSGDFYWMEKVNDHTVLVLADCTGHGVPGSFMTLLGFNLLNSIVLENGTVNPGQILNELDKKLKEYLPRGEGDKVVNDGMELTICVFPDNSNQMTYACAGSRFLIYEKNSFTMYKGDNKHIGDEEDGFEGYHSHNAMFTGDYNLFLFTDGFQDQFGGPKDKKYSFRRMLELFESNINLPLKEQKKMIVEDYEHWMGANLQTDDLTVMSIKRTINSKV